MKRKLATTLVLTAALVMSTFSVFSSTRPAQAASNSPNARWAINGLPPNPLTDNAILTWNEELLQAVRLHPGTTGPTVTSRAIAVLHTATYDAWAAYDGTAVPTLANGNGRETVTDPSANARPTRRRRSATPPSGCCRTCSRGTRYPFIESPNPAGKMADFKGQMAVYGFATDGSTPTPAAQVGARAADAVIDQPRQRRRQPGHRLRRPPRHLHAGRGLEPADRALALAAALRPDPRRGPGQGDLPTAAGHRLPDPCADRDRTTPPSGP